MSAEPGNQYKHLKCKSDLIDRNTVSSNTHITPSVTVKNCGLLRAELALKGYLSSVACYFVLLIAGSLFPLSFIRMQFFLRWMFYCNIFLGIL